MEKKDVEILYLKHSQLVYRFLLKLTGNSTEAEELMQETFYQAILSIERYQGNSSITTWLCQIAKNVWRNRIKKEMLYEYTSIIPDVPDDSPSIVDYIIDIEEKSEFYQALRNIPYDMREVMLLRIIGEYSFREISITLGKTETWARTNFYRGKQKIMKEVHKYED